MNAIEKQIDEARLVYRAMQRITGKLRYDYGCPQEIQFREDSIENDPYFYYFTDNMNVAIDVIERVFKEKKIWRAKVSYKVEEYKGVKDVTLIIITEKL